MRPPCTLAAALALGLGVATLSPAAAQTRFVVPRLPVERYVLANGLTVLLSRDTTVPVVSVDVWYHVGSKNERSGRTGLAHLFEHVMFQGSEHIPYGMHIKTIESAGGVMNGTTAEDRTNYFETMPSHRLETALWLESDRMGHLLPALDQRKLDAQREVVKNERRQRLDNQSFGTADEVVSAALFPPGNPYSWPVIGSMVDLSAATLADVEQFFRTYYAPNNATLAIVGDFDPATTRKLVARYFGGIPRGPAFARPSVVPAELPAERRLVVEDPRATVAQLLLAWPTVGTDHPDHLPLGALGFLLAHDRTGRLSRLLVYQRQLATEVGAQQRAYENGGQFQIRVVPRAGASLTEIERLVDSVVAALPTTSVTAAELTSYHNAVRVTSVLRLGETLARAEILAEGQVYHRDPLAYVKETEAKLALTPAQITHSARRYLGRGRVVLSMVPGGQLDRMAKPTAPFTNVTPQPESEQLSHAVASPQGASSDTAVTHPAPEPPVPPAKPLKFPPVQRTSLKNGVPVVILEDHQMPVVGIFTVFHIPEWSQPVGKEGVRDLVEPMLREGTMSRTGDQLAEAIAALGNDVSPRGFYTVRANADSSLALMADMLRHPSFPDSAFARLQANRLTHLQQMREDPHYLANRIFADVVYGPEHPYARRATERSVRALTREQVRRFYEAYYRPPNLSFVVAGDITADSAVAKLERSFGDWADGTKPDTVVATPPGVATTTIYLYDRPGSAQSVILLGGLAPRRDIPDFDALRLANIVFGGAFNSRLNLDLREKRQYAYGAFSWLTFRRPPEVGTFVAGASVATSTTDSAVVAAVRDLQEIVGDRPVTPGELELAKASDISSLPLRFETLIARAYALTDLIADDLPLDHYVTLIPRVTAVTAEHAQAAARKYFNPSRLAIVVVGDRRVIEPKLRGLPVAPVVLITQVSGLEP